MTLSRRVLLRTSYAPRDLPAFQKLQPMRWAPYGARTTSHKQQAPLWRPCRIDRLSGVLPDRKQAALSSDTAASHAASLRTRKQGIVGMHCCHGHEMTRENAKGPRTCLPTYRLQSEARDRHSAQSTAGRLGGQHVKACCYSLRKWMRCEALQSCTMRWLSSSYGCVSSHVTSPLCQSWQAALGGAVETTSRTGWRSALCR